MSFSFSEQVASAGLPEGRRRDRQSRCVINAVLAGSEYLTVGVRCGIFCHRAFFFSFFFLKCFFFSFLFCCFFFFFFF